MSLNRMLAAAAEEVPDRTAFLFLEDGEDQVRALTYGELHARACAVARRLAHHRPGDRALLLYPPGLDFLSAMFGALYRGLVAVPAHPPRIDRSLRRLEAIAADSDPAVVLTTRSIAERHARIVESLPALENPMWLATDDLAPDGGGAFSPASSSDLALLQYTSGSTGTPKGVMCTHDNVIHNASYVKEAYGVTGDTVCVTWLPHFHDMGLMLGLMQPLYARVLGVFLPPETFVQKPLRLLNAISRYRGSFAGGPNFCFDLCVRRVSPEERDGLDLSSWRCAYNGAEPVRRDTLERFAAHFAPAGFRARAFYPALGMAEATAHVSGGSIDDDPVYFDAKKEALEKHLAVEAEPEDPTARHLVGCGTGRAGTEIAAVDPVTLERCPDRRVGEIWVKGRSVAAGYWRREEDTERTFRARLGGDGPYLRTGDLGFLDRGELFVTGRLKDVIIIRGANHYPQDIELSVETSHPALRPGFSAAFGVEVSGQEQLVVIAETVRDVLDPEERDRIFDAVRRRVVEEHELEIHAIAILERGSIFKTSSGKIERKASKQAFEAGTLRTLAVWRAPSEPRESKAPDLSAVPVPSLSARAIEGWLGERIARRVGLEPSTLDRTKPFAAYGLASADAVELSGALEAFLGRRVAPTLFYDHPSLERAAMHLAGTGPSRSTRGPAPEAQDEPIAVLGLGLRFPGGTGDAQSFWSILERGADAIQEVPADRWPSEQWSGFGGFLEDVDRFDAGFFEIAPREAESMDPQQRLLLEVAYEALEDAGQRPDTLAGSLTGVFVGLCNGDYGQLLRARGPQQMDAYMSTGTSFAVAGGRISYTFGFEGPNISIDTACSASLVAVHLACRSLRSGESNLAIAGGVNVILTPEVSIDFSRANMLAADGRCKTFDAAADGYVRSEGCGLVVLKRLSDAQRDGDRILGILRGSAVNQDGRSNGLTAPNGRAQEAVIRRALAAAGVDPIQVGYVEAHGTGTPLGDPIELGALVAVYGKGDGPCRIGSVKTNLGHLESAAGIAGLIKVLLALEHETIPRHLHFERINPSASLEGTRLEIPVANQAWPRGAQRRIAGVSSFGLSGTNAHVVVEEAPERRPEPPRPRAERRSRVKVLPVSAKHEASLAMQCENIAEALERNGHDPVWLEAAIATAGAFRAHHGHRACAVGEDAAALARKLRAVRSAESIPGLAIGRPRSTRRPVVFVYSGQGSQWPGMGRSLFAEAPAYRHRLREADAALEGPAGFSVLEMLEAPPDDPRLRRVDVIQPLIFAVQLALTAQWRAWGVSPDAVMGHSMGEVAAGVVAGALSLEDGAKVIALRSRLVLPTSGRGRMALVELSAEKAEREIEAWPGVSIASYHGPEAVLLSGRTEAVEALVRSLEARGVFARLVEVDYASHSAEVDPILPELSRVLAGVRGRKAEGVLLCSTLEEEVISGEQMSGDYWVRNLRLPVRFHQAVEKLVALGHELFVEVSPHPVLAPTIERTLKDRGVAIGSLRRDRDEVVELAESLAELYAQGGEVDWRKWSEVGEPVRLPPYAWNKQRYWTSVHRRSQETRSGHAWLDRAYAYALEPTTRIWQGTLGTERLPHLDEHRVEGVAVTPGALWLEAALHAARASGRPACIEDIEFTGLLATGAGERTVQLVARTSGFELLSAPADESAWTRHAQGRWGSAAEAELESAADLLQAKKRCTRRMPGGELYQRLSSMGIEHGPRYASVHTVWLQDGEAIAELALSEAEPGRWTIEPWLLDAATHVLALADETGGEHTLLPAGIGRLSLFGRSGPRYQVHARWRRTEEGIEGDLSLHAEDGTVCAALERVRLRPAMRKRSAPRLFEVAWEELPPTQAIAGSKPAGPFAIAGSGAIKDALSARLGTRAVPLEASRGVVLVCDPEDRDPAKAAESAAIDLMRLTQSLVAAKDPPRLFIVTRGAQAIFEDEAVRPAGAAVWGLARTILHEHPELRPTCIDLFENAGASAVDVLADELAQASEEHQIALRPKGRFVARLAVVSGLTESAAIPVSSDGAYLITGGLGGLGLEVARALVEGGARHLVLAGRSEPSAEAKDRIDLLSAAGARVRTVRCDVARAAEVRDLVASIGPTLKGVVHAAGILADATILRAEPSAIEAVFAPKVHGAWNLHCATEHHPLDFFVLFSSAAAVLGSSGQAGYGAANAFLGALACHRRSLGLSASCVAFGAFEGTGLAAARADRGERLARSGLLGLTAAEGIDVLGAVIRRGATDVMALRFDAAKWTESHPRLAALPYFAPLAKQGAPRALGFRRALLEIDPRRRLDHLQHYLCEETARVLRQDAAQVRPWTPFAGLGLNSLMGLELRNRLELALELRLPASIMWTHRTVEALALHLADEMGLSAGAESAAPPKDRGEAEPPAKETYAALSDEEAATALVEKLDALDLER